MTYLDYVDLIKSRSVNTVGQTWVVLYGTSYIYYRQRIDENNVFVRQC